MNTDINLEPEKPKTPKKPKKPKKPKTPSALENLEEESSHPSPSDVAADEVARDKKRERAKQNGADLSNRPRRAPPS